MGRRRQAGARFPLQNAGLYVGAVQVATGAMLPLAPLSLPYSPKFEPRPDPEEGHKTLGEMARVTGGLAGRGQGLAQYHM